MCNTCQCHGVTPGLAKKLQVHVGHGYILEADGEAGGGASYVQN